jgi:uncharacterized protein YbaR (Trm112 family)
MILGAGIIYIEQMLESALHLLRCPIDPKRESMLTREDMSLVCACHVKFPIRQGLPILLSEEAELPNGVERIDHLPCQRQRRG